MVRGRVRLDVNREPYNLNAIPKKLGWHTQRGIGCCYTLTSGTHAHITQTNTHAPVCDEQQANMQRAAEKGLVLFKQSQGVSSVKFYSHLQWCWPYKHECIAWLFSREVRACCCLGYYAVRSIQADFLPHLHWLMLDIIRSTMKQVSRSLSLIKV